MCGCNWNSCQQRAYGGDEYCYYHKKVIKGLISLEDRSNYLTSSIEKEFVEKTDKENYDVKKQHALLKTPIVVEIIKLSLYIICKKTKLPQRHFISDVNLLALFHLIIPDTIYDYKKFVQYNAIRFVGILNRQYLKEKEQIKNEISLNPDFFGKVDPESEIIREQEEHLKMRAIYAAKKQMTKIERKVFNLLEKEEGETFISNKLHLSKPRVTKLKQRAFNRVRQFIFEFKN